MPVAAALAAAAANAQGKFFEYIEILYTHQDALDDASLKKYAADLGLNVKQFELDFNSDKTAADCKKRHGRWRIIRYKPYADNICKRPKRAPPVRRGF